MNISNRKSKNLNGLPRDILESYFSSLAYYDPGYTSDWLLNGAQKFNVKEVILDILNAKVSPAQLNIPALARHLKGTQLMIKNDLSSRGLSADVIADARIIASFDEPDLPERTFMARSEVKDKDGRYYEYGKVQVRAYEKYFDVDLQKYLS